MFGTYLQYWRINVLTFLEYRANFIMWACFTLVYHGTAIAALFVTLHQFPQMNSWDFKQMLFLYGLWMVAHELQHVISFGILNVPELIREGRFDRFLVRPMDTLFQVITVPQQVFPDGLFLAIVTLAIAIRIVGVHVDASFLLLVALTTIGGAMIDFGISLAIAAISFWFIRVETLTWVVMSLEQDFTRYPISIYSRGVQVVLAFLLPFAFMNYFPATYFLQKTDAGLHLNPAVGLLTPIIGLIWALLAYIIWRIGIQHYQGTGS